MGGVHTLAGSCSDDRVLGCELSGDVFMKCMCMKIGLQLLSKTQESHAGLENDMFYSLWGCEERLTLMEKRLMKKGVAFSYKLRCRPSIFDKNAALAWAWCKSVVSGKFAEPLVWEGCTFWQEAVAMTGSKDVKCRGWRV